MGFPSGRKGVVPDRQVVGSGHVVPAEQFPRPGLPQPGAPPLLLPGIGRRVQIAILLEEMRVAKQEKTTIDSFVASGNQSRVGLVTRPGPPWWAESHKEHQNITIRPGQPGHILHYPQTR